MYLFYSCTTSLDSCILVCHYSQLLDKCRGLILVVWLLQESKGLYVHATGIAYWQCWQLNGMCCKIMKHECLNQHKDMMIASVMGYDDAYKHLQPCLSQWRALRQQVWWSWRTTRRFAYMRARFYCDFDISADYLISILQGGLLQPYIVSCDASRAFDNVDANHLQDLVDLLFKNSFYQISSQAILLPSSQGPRLYNNQKVSSQLSSRAISKPDTLPRGSVAVALVSLALLDNFCSLIELLMDLERKNIESSHFYDQ